MSQGARAVGIANIAVNGTVLDTWFPSPELLPIGGTSGTHRVSAHELSPKFLKLIGADHDRLVELVPVCTVIADLDAPPIDAHDVFLRLHLLSHRMVEPLTINMAGALELLQPVVWTNKGPCLADNFETVRTNLRARGLIHVYGIDRLPRMVDYVVPSGVTIAEAERVRLGAYLAEGTSVMREGYVSYNAGSLGPARIEGRLSSSVVVGGGTDLSLSSALMASRVSEFERAPMRVGRDCRLHPSAGVIGVDLGDRCEIGVNVMLEPDTMVFDVETGTQVPARTIAGRADLRIEREPFSTSPVVRRNTLGVD
ncbi:2,3,4,5-tetrahydropyridine-2,6-dicarboxylate N-succinyltransferase [Corynebacterium afermentans subsp. afermentans]|uniref:2,3,4,5-tetrahydropyridine-2-carboxylate N-succinyltransferase n=1 Tax=Corynebacterium afermentans TaxID=38286 RepID=A0A9X8R1U7_9CORY|nr:succinyltransferase [Corynebacterium afermentans]OAA17122.1 succinyltransferase [Corynebacterium afermentans subsp. afermentans]WJY56465.1 2,3,4,5-tetrahydropyridine-2,6-dicarboxylate N-succinyltransferase [Corynebacterium afermentans subsp. afermentans]SIQ05603.1 2,3,4,5-tetrahydropyridine-2-carboxylate N-succinyltransferase [Corynebacterium afermentans]